MGRDHFARLLAGGRDDFPLDEAALLIAGAVRGPLDQVEWMATLDQIAADCPSPSPEGIARHLIDDLGFTGERRSYYDWRNSCLDHVLTVRRGIPITLAVVMLEVARRRGVPLHGVGMPAHFLVGTPGGERFFDPFHGSDSLDRSQVRARFEELTGGRTRWHEEFLDPTPPREIVARMLNNLRSVFEARHDSLRLAVVTQLRSAIPEIRTADESEAASALAVLN